MTFDGDAYLISPLFSRFKSASFVISLLYEMIQNVWSSLIALRKNCIPLDDFFGFNNLSQEDVTGTPRYAKARRKISKGLSTRDKLHSKSHPLTSIRFSLRVPFWYSAAYIISFFFCFCSKREPANRCPGYRCPVRREHHQLDVDKTTRILAATAVTHWRNRRAIWFNDHCVSSRLVSPSLSLFFVAWVAQLRPFPFARARTTADDVTMREGSVNLFEKRPWSTSCSTSPPLVLLWCPSTRRAELHIRQ